MRALYSGGDGAWKNDLSNSVALSAGKKLTYTPTVTGNRRQFTIMCNVRRTTFGATQYILSAINASLAAYWHFNSDDTLDFGLNGGGSQHVTSKVFRDTEPMFLGLAFDSVARTVKMVHNDQEIDSFSTATQPVASVETVFNMAGTTMELGAYNSAAGVLGANVSDFVILDSEVLTPQEMINYRTQNVPLGNNVITTTKKFTTEGKAARFYSLKNYNTDQPIVSNESQSVSQTELNWKNVHTEIIDPTLKFQVEVHLPAAESEDVWAGLTVATNNTVVTGTIQTLGEGTGIYFRTAEYLAYNNPVGNVNIPLGYGSAAGDMASFYVDMPNRKMYIRINGTYITGHNPEAGTGGYDINPADVRFMSSLYGMNGITRYNFGQTDYAYPVDGYGPLQEVAKSDLKRCKLLPSRSGTIGVLSQRGMFMQNTATTRMRAHSNVILPLNGGKYYMEVGLDTDGQYMSLGLAAPEAGFESSSSTGPISRDVGMVGVYNQSILTLDEITGTTNETIQAGSGGNETLLIAVDTVNNLAWFGRTDFGFDGDPAAGTGGRATTVTDLRLFLCCYQASALVNYGDSPWAATPPTGFVGPASLDFDTLRPSSPTALEATTSNVDIEADGLTVGHDAAVWRSGNSVYSMTGGSYYAELTINDINEVMVGIFGPLGKAATSAAYAQGDTHYAYSAILPEWQEYSYGSYVRIISEMGGQVQNCL